MDGETSLSKVTPRKRHSEDHICPTPGPWRPGGGLVLKIHPIVWPVCVCAKSLQSCPAFCHVMDQSPPGILQERILEWVAMPSLRQSSQSWNRTCVSCTADRFFTHWVTWEAQSGGLRKTIWQNYMPKAHFFSLLNYTAQRPIWSENTGLSKRLRLHYDSCHISMQLKKKKLIKTDFSCSHFNNEYGRKKATFLALYYFKKSKNATEMLKEERFVQYMEKVLWLIKHIRSCWWSFVLELSCWMMCHSQVDQLKLTELKSMRTPRTINVIPCAREADILKISKSSVENHLQQHGCVHLFDVWVPHKLIKKNLDHISAYDFLLNGTKNVHF